MVRLHAGRIITKINAVIENRIGGLYEIIHAQKFNPKWPNLQIILYKKSSAKFD